LVNEGVGCAGLGALSRKIAPHLDDVVGNHAQPYPSSHAVQTGIQTTTQPVSSFEHADSALRTGSPLLSATKPTLVLKKFPFATCGFLVGHRHPLHPQRLSPFLVLARIKSRIGGHHARDSSQPLLVYLDRGQQQSRVCRTLGKHLKVGHDLVLRFLNLDQLAKLVGLARFPFANDFRVRFEHAHDLSRRLRVSCENSCPRLLHYLPHPSHHRLQPLRQTFHWSATAPRRLLYLSQYSLRLIDYFSCQAEKLPILPFSPLFSGWPQQSGRQGNRQNALAYAAHAIPHLTFQTSRLGLDLLHGARQYPRAVPQQTTVGRIMNVGFHYRRIHPQLPSPRHPSLLRQFHPPLMQLLYDFRSDQLPQPCQGLSVRHFFISDPGKGAIHQIGPHLSFQHVIAPV